MREGAVTLHLSVDGDDSDSRGAGQAVHLVNSHDLVDLFIYFSDFRRRLSSRRIFKRNQLLWGSSTNCHLRDLPFSLTVNISQFLQFYPLYS